MFKYYEVMVFTMKNKEQEIITISDIENVISELKNQNQKLKKYLKFLKNTTNSNPLGAPYHD